jgi:pyruvate dehydrogenase E2 component (dihydrolipoamide acetyltransferase)
MTIVIRMPEVLAGATEGVISRWSVAEGDEVNVGDVLAEIETDKASVEYQAEDAGTVARLLAAEGDMVDVGTPIAVFATAGDTESDIDTALANAGVTSDPHHVAAAPVGVVEPPSVIEESSPVGVSVHGVEDSGGRLRASPIVRKIAKEQGLDLSAVAGSGPSGRIVRRDIDRLLESGAPARPTAVVPSATSATYSEVPHSSMRRAIARRLTESKSTVPHFYLKADCIVDRLLEARSQVNEALGVKTSVNDWVVKAVAHALMAVPAANVVWSDQSMRQFSQADISVAVATEGGLYTPVLRGVERMSIPEIGERIRDLAERARQGKIKHDEIEGGSFAVTNLGMFGTEEFSAILNPPQSGILAVGAAREKAVATNGTLGIATVMTVTLSADHRAVDGALAAQWMAAFKNAIEHPLLLVL